MDAQRPAADPMLVGVVLAALSRLARRGTWARILDGEVPAVDDGASDVLDLADIDLLEAAGLLVRSPERLVLLRQEAWLRSPEATATGTLARLLRAVQHAQGADAGWTGADADLVLAQGRASRQAAVFLCERLLPTLPDPPDLDSGTASFLDVGVGVAAIAIEMCRRHPGLRATGLDVMPEALALAREEIAAVGMADRVELREQSVADLTDEAAHDMAWVPQPFIPPAPFRAGLTTVHRALRPGGLLVVPLLVAPSGDPFEEAVWRHSAHLVGGGPLSVAETHDLLSEAGFTDLGSVPADTQVVVHGRRRGRVDP